MVHQDYSGVSVLDALDPQEWMVVDNMTNPKHVMIVILHFLIVLVVPHMHHSIVLTPQSCGMNHVMMNVPLLEQLVV
jgi:hypothetical protein